MSRPPIALRDRTAVITGAGSGIGRALALKAAAKGMRVAICDRDAVALEESARLVREGGAHVLARAIDVTDLAAMSAFARDVATTGPSVALLFANAGVLRLGSVLAQPLSDWRLMFEVNVVGVVATVQAFAPIMQAAGDPAQIVITSSTGALSSAEGFGAYCGTKHALIPIAEELRRDLGKNGASIGVSLLMPGAVATHIFDASDPNRAPQPDSISPREAAEIAFEHALADTEMILTHPAHVERARKRFDRMLRLLAMGPSSR